MEQPPVIQRLHALSERGYVAELGGTKTPYAVWLRHPGLVKYRSLTLFGDGLVIGQCGDGKLRFYADDEQEFDKFVRGVPTPTLWDRYKLKSLTLGVVVGFGALSFWLANH